MESVLRELLPSARNRFLAARVNVGRDYEDWKHVPYSRPLGLIQKYSKATGGYRNRPSAECLFLEFVLRVFEEIAGDIIETAKTQKWTLDRAMAFASEFLRVFTIDAKGHEGLGTGLPSSMHSNWNGGLDPFIEREIRLSSQWKAFEDKLIEIETEGERITVPPPMDKAESCEAAEPNLDPASTQDGNTGVAPATSPDSDARVIRREGHFWKVVFNGNQLQLRHSKGLHYLSFLLNNPGKEWHVSDLLAAAEGNAVVPRATSAGEVLDAQAIGAYRAKAQDLASEIAEARKNNDKAKEDTLMKELKFVSDELSSAKGQKGKVRLVGSTDERARKSVREAVARVKAQICPLNRDLHEHLRETIKLGNFASYDGNQAAWEL